MNQPDKKRNTTLMRRAAGPTRCQIGRRYDLVNPDSIIDHPSTRRRTRSRTVASLAQRAKILLLHG